MIQARQTYVDRLEEYVESVLVGTVPVSSHVFAACERHRRDRSDPRFDLDAGELERGLAFVESIPQIRGDHVGDQFQLQGWQVFVLGSLIGWRWSDSGLRRYRFALVELARKQGKTTMMAALLLYFLHRGPEGGHSFCFGTARHVSMLSFTDIRAMLIRMGEDTGTRSRPRRTVDGIEYEIGTTTIRCEERGTRLEALTCNARTLDGLDPVGYVCDEASLVDGAAFAKLYTSTVGRDEALGICVTTPAESDDGTYHQHRSTGMAVLHEDHQADRAFYFFAGLDPTDDIEDRSCWVKAMPSLGHTCHLDVLDDQYKLAVKSGPQHVREFRRFHLCEWVGLPDPYLPLEWIKRAKRPMPDLAGRRCWAGLDLSKSRDLSSLVVVTELESGDLYIDAKHWYPRATARDREGSYRMPLLQWGNDPSVPLTLVPGEIIDYEAIQDAVIALHESRELIAIWTDPMLAGWGEAVCERAGVNIGNLKQSIQYLSPGTIKVEELFASESIYHSGDPVLCACLNGARVWSDPNGNRRLDKRRSDGLIDPAVALVIAVSAKITCSPASKFEHENLRVF